MSSRFNGVCRVVLQVNAMALSSLITTQARRVEGFLMWCQLHNVTAQLVLWDLTKKRITDCRRSILVAQLGLVDLDKDDDPND